MAESRRGFPAEAVAPWMSRTACSPLNGINLNGGNMINRPTSWQDSPSTGLAERSVTNRQRRFPSSSARACRWPGIGWLAAATLLLASSLLHAETRVSVTATDPMAETVLGKGQPFHVRISFETDQPVGIWARPYAGGKPVKRYFSNASGTHVGTGEALGWFALNEATDVDEVRIFVGGGQPWREWQAAVVPVRLRVAAEGATAPWVADLQEAARVAQKTDEERRRNAPASVGDTVLFSGFMLFALLLLVGGLAAPLWAMWKWHGGWRLAAAVPAAVMGFVVLRIIVGTSHDPTSHNLWPFEILSSGVVALAMLAALFVARRFTAVPG